MLTMTCNDGWWHDVMYNFRVLSYISRNTTDIIQKQNRLDFFFTPWTVVWWTRHFVEVNIRILQQMMTSSVMWSHGDHEYCKFDSRS